MKRFRSRRFAMLLILMLTLSMAIQGVAPVAFAEESSAPQEGVQDVVLSPPPPPPLPVLEIHKEANRNAAAVGEYVLYHIEIRSGHESLTDVVVSDSALGWSETIGTLGPHQSKEYYYYEDDNDAPVNLPLKHLMTESDFVNNEFINTAIVSGKAGDAPVSSQATFTIKRAAIELVKTVEPTSAMIGDEVVYSFVVKNTGSVDLYKVSIWDKTLHKFFYVGRIAANSQSEAIPYERELRLFDKLENHIFTNTAVVKGHYCAGGKLVSEADVGMMTEGDMEVEFQRMSGYYVTDEATAALTVNPDITIQKTVSLFDSGLAPVEDLAVGSLTPAVQYHFIVSNISERNLYRVTITDNTLGLTSWDGNNDNGDAGYFDLPVGESEEFDYVYAIAADKWQDNKFVNTAFAEASYWGEREKPSGNLIGSLSDVEIACIKPITSFEDSATVTYVAPIIPVPVITTTTTTTGERDRAEPAGSFIPAEPVPLAAPVIIPAPVVEPVIMDEVIPLGVPVLPKTGELPMELFYGLGGMLTAIGAYLKRR